METLVILFKNLPEIVTAIVSVITSLIGLFMLIPGDQPEKALKKFIDMVENHSKK